MSSDEQGNWRTLSWGTGEGTSNPEKGRPSNAEKKEKAAMKKELDKKKAKDKEDAQKWEITPKQSR